MLWMTSRSIFVSSFIFMLVTSIVMGAPRQTLEQVRNTLTDVQRRQLIGLTLRGFIQNFHQF